MEQLVLENCPRLSSPRQTKLWQVVTPNAKNQPNQSSFVIINNHICSATFREADVTMIPSGVMVHKDILPTTTLANIQACLQRKTNDTFPVQVYILDPPTDHVLESPCMFVETQTPTHLVLRHAWWVASHV